jgi:hypothetical protein
MAALCHIPHRRKQVETIAAVAQQAHDAKVARGSDSRFSERRFAVF